MKFEQSLLGEELTQEQRHTLKSFGAKGIFAPVNVVPYTNLSDLDVTMIVLVSKDVYSQAYLDEFKHYIRDYIDPEKQEVLVAEFKRIYDFLLSNNRYLHKPFPIDKYVSILTNVVEYTVKVADKITKDLKAVLNPLYKELKEISEYKIYNKRDRMYHIKEKKEHDIFLAKLDKERKRTKEQNRGTKTEARLSGPPIFDDRIGRWVDDDGDALTEDGELLRRL